MAIIRSLLDTDLYKFTMMQAVLNQFPSTEVEYEFRCRDPGIDLTPYQGEIEAEIDHLCTLRFQPDELAYLNQLPFIKANFLRHLRVFQLSRDDITVIAEGRQLKIQIRGSWYFTILFEVPVLAIVNEVYTRHTCPDPDLGGAQDRLQRKMELVARHDGAFKFADFGTRRRFSLEWHRQLLETMPCLRDPNQFVGTSNVLFAKEFGVRPIGTMAHEWLQAGQAMGVPLIDSQRFMLQHWADEYRGSLGIALTDVIGTQAFMIDFDAYFAKLYDGVRQDSGDPIEFGERIIEHYQGLGIDPLTKTIVFSDGLTFERAEELLRIFQGRIHVSFGIGTNLTNDIPGNTPLQIVIKMVRCNNRPVAKISDTPGKGMCQDAVFLAYLKKVFAEKMAASEG
jgi:nicotinate phosphoribosyltransferase